MSSGCDATHPGELADVVSHQYDLCGEHLGSGPVKLAPMDEPADISVDLTAVGLSQDDDT